jgi:hypothetical protein
MDYCMDVKKQKEESAIRARIIVEIKDWKNTNVSSKKTTR